MSQTNGRRLKSEASGMWRIRTLPNPLGCLTSTAIATMHFLAPRPRLPPCSTPPTSASPTSTSPDSCLRSDRTIAIRNRCKIAQATRYLTPNVRSRVLAEKPFLAVVTCQADSNHAVKGVRVFSRIVPAVIDVWWRQAVQTNRPRVCFQGASTTPQTGHWNPVGQRKFSKYATHAASS